VGDTVPPTGYDAPEKEEPGYEEAKEKLRRLILNEKVEIKNPQTIDDWGRLVADVFSLPLCKSEFRYTPLPIKQIRGYVDA